MKRLLFALALCGCDAPDSFQWTAFPDSLPLTTPLVTGGSASMTGFSHAYDVTSLSPQVATATYGETTHTEGNDGPFSRQTYTDRFINVTGVAPGAVEIDLRRQGSGSISERLMITVANPGKLAFTDDYKAIFADDRVTPQFVLTAADGSAMVGTGAVGCAMSGQIVSVMGCELTSAGLGDGVVTGSSSGLTVDVPLRVVQPSDVRSIDFGMLVKQTGFSPSIRVIPQTDVGPAHGGAFQCTSDLDPSVLLLDTNPATGSGSELSFYNPPGGHHTVTCTLGAQSASTTVDL
jgi:hypothetical protein